MTFQQLNEQDLQQYLERIQCSASLTVDPASLERLQRSHTLHIPFENLNPWLGLPVALSRQALMLKLVSQRRGGYCFEQNLLLGNVLATLGFDVSGLAAQVTWMQPPGAVVARTHMALLVTLNRTRYIVDAGFGGITLTAPLLLDTDAPQPTSHESFRIHETGQEYTVSVQLNGAWQDMYRFTLLQQQYPDYEMANWYVGSFPGSRFVNNLIAARVDTDGRHALQNLQYTRHYLHKASERIQLSSPSAVREVLEKQFRIDTAALPQLDERLRRLFAENPSSQ